MTNRKRRFKKNVILLPIILLVIFSAFLFCFKSLNKKQNSKNNLIQSSERYVASNTTVVDLYDDNYEKVSTINRGEIVKTISKAKVNNDISYTKITYNKKNYYIVTDNLTKEKDKIITETEVYIRTTTTLYKNEEGVDILSTIKKGEKVTVTGYDYIVEGKVNMYKIKYKDLEGYIYSKYTVLDHNEAILNYDEDNTYQTHLKRTNVYGGGNAYNLDFYPVDKPKFENNIMPDEVRSLYINSIAVKNIDKYIELAKESNINAFVVDIKDNTSPAYASKVMQEYSKTNYENANNTFENYKAAIKKIKDNGFYVIGRITTFKDNYYSKDHPENTIKNSNGEPFNHDNSYWPTAYNRHVWEFNVKLAIEAVDEMGFNEIQFDYVRFPDRTNSLEKQGVIDFQNTYNEDKAVAIQQFLFYATDAIHKHNAYVSADVFGESAHNYVTAYGQYWGAISNVVDVISAMPYPDHFSKYEYGFNTPVWTIPYDVIYYWASNFASKQQQLIPTPAIARTWIQCYNTNKEPSVIYDASKISAQIKALKDANLTGGFMTWNSSSSLEKYEAVKSAF